MKDSTFRLLRAPKDYIFYNFAPLHYIDFSWLLPQKSRAPAPPSVESTSSDSPHVSSISSEDAKSSASEIAQKTKEKASELSKEAQEKGSDLSNSASTNYNKAKRSASKKLEQAEDKAVGARDELSANKDNPVVVGNAVLIAVAAIGLGVGAYQKHAKGELNWGLVGTWAGVVGLFATGDYFLSQWVITSWRFSLL